MHSNDLEIIDFGASFDELVMNCYLAFCPASTMAVELSAAGIPVGIGLAVENQATGHFILDEKNLACPIGKYVNNNGWVFNLNQISSLIESSDFRDTLSSNAINYFNLEGAHKSVDLIINLLDSPR